MKTFFRFFFRLIWRIIRIILILGILLAIYLAFQYFVNQKDPREVITSLQTQVEETSDTIVEQVDTMKQENDNTSDQDTTINTTSSSSPTLCHETDCYSIEIADTPASRQQGLMFREHLRQDHGMLFVFEEPGTYNFWMKNTKLTLDMIWISKNYQIVHIESNVPPCTADPCPSYGPKPGTRALYVLELNGGEASDWKVGNFLTTNYIKQ